MNGAILGMRRAEIVGKFDEIVAFAGTEKFLDMPVKHYSSGMYTRLAFAVAAHLDPEILIVDEVLAVGDLEFQRKCMGKMGEVARQGRTVLFVSHNVGAISALCNRCLLLSGGRVVLAGDTRSVVGRYLSEPGAVGSTRFDPPPAAAVAFAGCAVLNRAGAASATVGVDEPFAVRLDVDCRTPVADVEVTVRVDNAAGQPVFSTNRSDADGRLARLAPGRRSFTVPVPARFLVPDQYSLVLGLHRPGVEVFDLREHALTFTVEEVGSTMARYHGARYGVVLVDFPWEQTGGTDA